mmetsp:Transcript_2492/g.4949  ORF Transcript_2492/g.4949 Transcript_2492/m.4949 type:complete len:310 (-) Transcript_2492:305-1234(-)
MTMMAPHDKGLEDGSLDLPLLLCSGSEPPQSNGSIAVNADTTTYHVNTACRDEAKIAKIEYDDASSRLRNEYLEVCSDLNSLAESVFSNIRSASTATRICTSNEAEEYELCGPLKRAFPERSFALIVTLILELPTLFLISGGSDRLCTLIGRKKYTSLIAMLPIASAISGNVGLQASTLTTRAISHGQVRVDNYAMWLRREIVAAFYLGIAIGVVVSSIAYCIGGFSFPFALSILVAQFIGILTAGFTGTLAPLLFTFIFKRDSGKWGGPLETAVQDVVGSFSMIVITYYIMLFFGPFELEPNDICSVS